MNVKQVKERISIASRRYYLCKAELLKENRILMLEKMINNNQKVIEGLTCEDTEQFGAGLIQVNLDLCDQLKALKKGEEK